MKSDQAIWSDRETESQADEEEEKKGSSCFGMASLVAWVVENGTQVVSDSYSTTLQLLTSRFQNQDDDDDDGEEVQLITLSRR